MDGLRGVAHEIAHRRPRHATGLDVARDAGHPVTRIGGGPRRGNGAARRRGLYQNPSPSTPSIAAKSTLPDGAAWTASAPASAANSVAAVASAATRGDGLSCWRRSRRWVNAIIADWVARALRQVATWVPRPTSATAMNVAAKSRVMLGVGAVRMGLHNMRGPCTFQAVRPQTLGLIGLGAIGGSIARQVKSQGVGARGAGLGAITVVGWSAEPAERALAA